MNAAAVVKGLDLQNVVLVGHSMGSAVILEAARLLPGQVGGVVSVDALDGLDTWWTPQEIEGFLIPFREDSAEETRTWVRSMFVEEEQVKRALASLRPPQVAHIAANLPGERAAAHCGRLARGQPGGSRESGAD